jgi:hypothetical protein
VNRCSVGRYFFASTRISTGAPHHVHIICTCFPQLSAVTYVTHVVV